MNKSLNLKEAFSFAYNQIKNNFLFLIISFNVIPFFLTAVLWVIITQFTHLQRDVTAHDSLAVIGIIFLLALYVLYALGAAYVGLRLVDQKSVKKLDILSQYHLVMQGILVYLAYWTLVSIGLFLFAIPGLYLAMRWFFFPYALVEGYGIRGSLNYSAKLSQGIKLHLLGYLIVIAVIIAIPILNFFAPIISSLVGSWIYRHAENQHKAWPIADIA